MGAEEEHTDTAGAQARGGETVTQAMILKEVAIIAPKQLGLELTAPIGPNLTEEDRAEAGRRYRIIEPLVESARFAELWAQAAGMRLALIKYLTRQHQIGQTTIYRWLKAFKARGLPGLVTRDRADKGRPRVMTPAALDWLLAAALPKPGVYGELSAKEIYRAYQEERAWRATRPDKTGPTLPQVSYRTLCEWAGRIPEVVRVMAREGEEAFAATQEIISFRDLSAIQPLDYVVMDHRRLDFFCMVHTGKNACATWKLVRPWLTAALDMRTRKWLAWAIVETPSSDSIASVLRRVIMQWGIPAACYWDNGKDFCSKWLEGRPLELEAGMRGVLETLGIRVHHAIVKRARSKIIEPCFLATSLFDRTLPWWCGHTAQARPERLGALIAQHERWVKGEAPAPAFPEIEHVAELYSEFLGTLNERDHPGQGMGKVTPSGRGWMCPNECWERLIPRVARRMVSPEVIQFAFAKRKRLTVQQGEVRTSFGGRQCHYRIIGQPIALMALNGREVELAYDPHDLGNAVVYAEGQLVGIAENVELRRMGEKDFVADERDRRAARREVKKFITAVHQQVQVPGPVERMERRMAMRPAMIEAPAEAGAGTLKHAPRAEDEGEFEFFQGGRNDGRVIGSG